MLEALETEIQPSKKEKLPVSIGPVNADFTTHQDAMESIEKTTVAGVEVEFEVKLGKLSLLGKNYEETFVLEIDHERSDLHSGMQAFGNSYFHDYGEAANKIAEQICEEFGLKIFTHVTSWPKFQALVAKTPEKKVAEEVGGVRTSVANIA